MDTHLYEMIRETTGTISTKLELPACSAGKPELTPDWWQRLRGESKSNQYTVAFVLPSSCKKKKSR